MKAYLQHGEGAGPFLTKEVPCRGNIHRSNAWEVFYEGFWRSVRGGPRYGRFIRFANERIKVTLQ